MQQACAFILLPFMKCQELVPYRCIYCVQSSRFTFPLDEPTLEWCLIGELGLLVDSPEVLIISSGSSFSALGVNPLSIVVFSYLAIWIGGGRPLEVSWLL
jgi:hypothetical protein